MSSGNSVSLACAVTGKATPLISSNTALSGIDTDLNGLDDVYNLNAIPLDSDTDGVYDFYDLDSDNDGIYDLEESSSTLPDSNFDGIIDNINTKAT